MRAAAGVLTIENAPIQFDVSSSHSVQGTLEIPLEEMLGVISHLRTTSRLPTSGEDVNYAMKSFSQISLLLKIECGNQETPRNSLNGRMWLRERRAPSR
jgi:hypothetical protein